MTNKSPCISVIMSVYNAEKYLGDCILSILGQTFSDFEFIIINDASTDSSPEIIKSFKDKRIRLLNNRERSYPTRNKGLRVARGKYICIMDADDISLPHRFERQVLFMEQNPQYGLAGSGYRVLGKDKDLYREGDYEKIKVQLMRNNCFIHPSVIIRHDLLKKHKLRYIRKYYYSSDYDFLARAARYFPVTNIPEVLMHYRVHEGQVTMQYRKRQAELADEISIDQLRFIGINPTQEDIGIHLNLLKGIPVEYSQKQELYKWINRIREANLKAGFYDKNELETFFDSLLSLQRLCIKMPKMSLESKRNKDIKNNKTDLMDVTFVVPLRINSIQMIENINTVIRYLNQHFKSNIIIFEIDNVQRYFPEDMQNKLTYRFIENHNKDFHRTECINQLLRCMKTPIVAIWNDGIVVSPKQIEETIARLRIGEAFMGIPYDGPSYLCDRISYNLFIKDMSINTLVSRIPVMQLINGFHSTDGAFIVNREGYIKIDGENENLTGFKYEGNECIKRVETCKIPIFRSQGPMFTLSQLEKNGGYYS